MSAIREKLHIDAPEMLTAPERTRDTLFTAIMWAIYLYLWVPLLSMLAWLLGFEFAYDVMIRTGGIRELGGILVAYGVIVTVIFATVAFWSLSNRVRYGKLKRRKKGPCVTTAEIAEYFDVDECATETLRRSTTAAIEFDDEGRPLIQRLEAER
jgi:biofilm PGA synthesis protein PgaD